MIPTKSIIPGRSERLLSRSRLIDQLLDHVDLALTFVTAPAGYGKTSLLVDFAHRAPFQVCWLSLDESDQDLRTFVEYLVAAVQRAFPEFGQTTLRVLKGSTDLRPTPAFMTGAIIQDMLDHVPEFFALILDDYHSVDESQEVNALLERFLVNRPEHCHLILASRTAPSGLPIIHLTARSQVAGIGPAHLAFTADEIRAFLAQAHSIQLSAAQAQELAAESEGWITGILLSTEALWRGMRDILARARAQEGPVYTYLAEQVFAEQPPELCDFLLASSTLAEMNEALCQEALGLESVAETLKEIERRGVFVTPVVDEATGVWYRYHHLFREFLQDRLRTRDAERFFRLHQRTADWFESRAQWGKAVSHRLAAGEMRATARTMDAGLTSLYYAGRSETLVGWYEQVPEALRSEYPRLSLFAARALVSLGRPDDALPLLRQAEAAFSKQGDTERVLLTVLTRTNIGYVRARYPEVLRLAEEVLAQAQGLRMPAADAHRMAGLACLSLGRPQSAVDHFRAALSLFRELGMVAEMGMVYLDLSLALLRLGRLSEGWTCQDRAIELFRAQDSAGLLATTLNNVAYERHYLSGDYPGAVDHLEEALRVAEEAGAARAHILALLTLADLYRDLGALAQADRLYLRAEEMAQRLDSADLINFVLSGRAQVRAIAGDVVEALSLATQARDQAERREDIYQLGLCSLTLGTAHLEAGHAARALEEITRGRHLLTQCDARRDLTRAYALLAQARYATQDEAGAQSALFQAIEIGIETRTYHYLTVEGQRAFDLLRGMQEQHPEDRRIAEILERIRRLPEIAREVVGGLEPGATPYTPGLRFFGFGPGGVEKGGEPVLAWRSALARHLLFYFLVHPPQTRQQIEAAFWPDLTPERAKAIFHVVKHQAHRAVGRTLIVYQDGLYAIEPEPDLWFDVAAFESLLDGTDRRQARLEEAVVLYKGDFLDGYDSEWCVPIREHLRLRYRDALLELGQIYIEQKRFDRAFAQLSRAAALDDLHEESCRALMRLYALDGRTQAALNQYHRLVERLAEELGTTPAAETQSLFEAIQTSKSLR